METSNNSEAVQVVMAYHERTKHHLNRYAAGPEALDWDTQPNPFRTFTGSPRRVLPLLTDETAVTFAGLPAATFQPFTLQTVAQFLELSLGLAAWKEYGPNRWALRCNPSSGNLHPTEAYVLAFGVQGISDGLYHYLSLDHLLEQRWYPDAGQPGAGLYIGLSSIAWREAWKYGERALRYCQLDIGHALGALRYAAGTLGWHLRLRGDVDDARLRSLLGLDRSSDFAQAEGEDAELLLEILPADTMSSAIARPAALPGQWRGQANCLDPHPLYRWPVIAETTIASRMPVFTPDPLPPDPWPARKKSGHTAASTLIRRRRSAQRFDPKTVMATDDFFTLLDALLPRSDLPWDAWPFTPHIHPILFVHRVEGLNSGLYALPRTGEGEQLLRMTLHPDFSWETVADAPVHLPLWRLYSGDVRSIARTLSCHQAIAADSCFAVAFLAEYADSLKSGAWHYRLLYQEAGLLGQILYLEAESLGLNGTGIGCFFDDAVHEKLGIRNNRLQSLYHFTVGHALTDTRISTLPPYTQRELGTHTGVSYYGGSSLT
ncbi:MULTISPECIES: SagB/ThcOx family dehydrogenase [Acidithiobacillus]|uniref:SagB/ThcOx family dehydrogenase n=1 Tax=Acidithiobacillus TaxID=119977 RepID=UPI001879237D|nr:MULTISPECIES: SagB/ThcOx family dehydrogenase [Acidithiobacillus]MBE7567838.1 SagB/ThcOx family dehydrogenase [Acidithiobacillus sp. HP-11]MBU2792489.1 SagB/ThcOx family dehydrogenase [Acidithiobacillus thiooxidans]